jgi:staphylococcal nuclease domain-containing protein 1
MSGDTCVLTGSGGQQQVFTLERVSAPRLASKANNNIDEPGAFPSREWLRSKVVGKSITFETKKQGASAGDRVYGLLLLTDPETGKEISLNVESVRNGHATPKFLENENEGAEGEENGASDYETQLKTAYQEAKEARVGIHSDVPLVRTIRSAGTDFEALALVEKSQKLCQQAKVKCVIEYIFDGSRFRCQITDSQLADANLQYGSFTLLLAGVTSPRVGNPRATPPIESEPFSLEARQFVEVRLLQRELDITLHGTDKSGTCIVGTIHRPRGNIAVELLKNGLARMSDWSVRMMSPMDVPALRVAENQAKVRGDSGSTGN